LLALAARSKSFSPDAYLRPAWVTFLVASPLVLITAGRVEWAVYSFTALASVSFVYVALFSKQRWVRAIMANRFLVFTGVISYGIYLLEKIPTDIALSLHLDHHPIVMLAITSVATYALAILSWNFLEKPFLRLKRYFEEDDRTSDSPAPVLVSSA
jgi:peptidoglycan/LPS O-acetylase OafA/YrhL